MRTLQIAVVSFGIATVATAAPLTSINIGDWSKEYTAWGHVVSLETGWSADTMSVEFDPSVPFVNSYRHNFAGGGDSCGITNAGYALDPTDPGVKAHEAALLAGFVAGKHVRVLISGCVFGKPRIIAVGLTD
jgi:hypothetical protein